MEKQKSITTHRMSGDKIISETKKILPEDKRKSSSQPVLVQSETLNIETAAEVPIADSVVPQTDKNQQTLQVPVVTEKENRPKSKDTQEEIQKQDETLTQKNQENDQTSKKTLDQQKENSENPKTLKENNQKPKTLNQNENTAQKALENSQNNKPQSNQNAKSDSQSDQQEITHPVLKQFEAEDITQTAEQPASNRSIDQKQLNESNSDQKMANQKEEEKQDQKINLQVEEPVVHHEAPKQKQQQKVIQEPLSVRESHEKQDELIQSFNESEQHEKLSQPSYYDKQEAFNFDDILSELAKNDEFDYKTMYFQKLMQRFAPSDAKTLVKEKREIALKDMAAALIEIKDYQTRQLLEDGKICIEVSTLNSLFVEQFSIQFLKIFQPHIKKDIVQAAIIEKQLREAKKIRHELLDKLKNLDNSIEKIKEQDDQDEDIIKNQSKQHRINETEEQKQQREKLVKKLNRERRLRQKQKLELLKQREQQEKQAEQLKRIIEEKAKKENYEKKKEKIQEHIRQIRKKQQEREKKLVEENEKIKELKEKKPLYVESQQRFIQTAADTLQEQKKKLAEIRDLHKPIDYDQLKEHEKRYMQKQLKTTDEKAKRGDEKSSDKSHYQIPYIGEKYKLIELENKKREEEQKEQENKLKVLLEKQKQFIQQCIKPPQVDVNKRQQMEEQIAMIHHKPDFHQYKKYHPRDDSSLQAPGQKFNASLGITLNDDKPRGINNVDISTDRIDRNDRNKIGLEYLKIAQKKKKNSIGEIQITSQFEQVSLKHGYKSDQSITKSLNREDELTRNKDTQSTHQKFNYLAELKEERHKNPVNLESIEQKQFDQIINDKNATQYQKVQSILMETELLEEKAQMKQKLMKSKHQQDKNEQIEESDVDDMYIQSIKAKLALLEYDSNQKQEKPAIHTDH